MATSLPATAVRVALVLASAVAGCSTSPDVEPARTEEALAERASCDAIRIDLTAPQVDAHAGALLEALRRAGSPNARIERVTDRMIDLEGLAAPFAGEAEPRSAVLRFLESLGSDLLGAGRLRHAGSLDLGGGHVLLSFGRILPPGSDGLTFPTALGATMQRRAGTWELRALRVVVASALATTADLERLARCTPSAPPPLEGSLRHRFISTKMSSDIFCRPEFDREYTPNAHDSLELVGENEWRAWRAEGSPDLYWRVVRLGYFHIAPANYWPDIEWFDVSCPPGGDGRDERGWLVTVDGRTGEILSSVPGIGCIGC